MIAELKPIPYTVMSEADATPVQWLWKPYIPKGALSMIMGDGGYGKSYMTCALAADLSAGRALPGQEPLPPQRILMISAEDGIGPIIKPRLELLGANMENIAAYDEGFTVNETMAKRILLAVKEYDAAIVFLDPMVVYVGGDTDIFKANEVRHILEQLNKIAKECNIAIVGVHHVKKAMTSNLQHKSLGSVDFVNGVRSTMFVDISKSGTYYMQHVKHNWSKKGDSLAYAFTDDRFEWLGVIEPEVGDVHEISRTPRGKARSFLIAVLSNGPVPMLDVIKHGKDEGLSETTINRAKRGVCHSIRKEGRWFYELDPGVAPLPPLTNTTANDALAQLAEQTPGLSIMSIEEELIAEAKRRLNGQQ